jgi:plastocyanin
MPPADGFTRRIRVPALAILVLSGILTSCGGGSGGSGESAPVDDTAPAITGVLPKPDADGIPLNSGTAAVFSEPLDPSSVNSGTVFLRSDVPVSGTVRYNEDLPSVSFTPSIALAPGTDYIMTITQQVRDKAGNPLSKDFAWIFTTGDAADTVSPVVTLINPPSGVTGVSVNSSVSATFSKPMDPTTMNTASFQFKNDSAQPVDGELGYDGLTAVFTPKAVLEKGRTYTATLTTGIGDLTGNPLASNSSWSFTTGTGTDKTAPEVVSTDPADGSVGFPVDGEVSAVFSEPMDPTTLNTQTFIVSFGVQAAGTVRYESATQTAVWTPSTALKLDTSYAASLTTGVKDLAGNRLEEVKTWSFRTAPLVSIVSGAFSLCEKAYSPDTITIPVGTMLTWKNNDALAHTVTSSDGMNCTPGNALDVADRELNLGIDPGGTASHVFDTPGTYPYVCVIPGHSMRGTVIVQ